MQNNDYLILTVDVEDWFQSTWDNSLPVNDNSKRNVEFLLDILSSHSCRATMFISGKFAQAFPFLIKEIQKQGHEIASHGFMHKNLLLMSDNDFKEDVLKSKKILEDIIGKNILGFRAPDFSLSRKNFHFLELLSELGFAYDASIFPIKLKRYGVKHWPPCPKKIILNNNKYIFEFPIGISYLFGLKVPIGGGGYHRIFPKWFILWMIKRALKINKYFVCYFHPYEFNFLEFKKSEIKIPLRVKLHQGFGRKGFLKKFISILKNFNVYKIEDVLKSKSFEEIKIERNKVL